MFSFLRQNLFGKMYRYFAFLVVWSKGQDSETPPSTTPHRIKQLVNDPQSAIFDSLLGMSRIRPFLKLTACQNSYIMTTTNQPSKDSHVALISGGPSGHEPLDALYVGKRMLSASVCGNRIFTPPDVMSIYRAIKMVTGKAGCILLIRNDPLNVLNFSLASQWARRDGLKVGKIIVADDCSFRLNKNEEKGVDQKEPPSVQNELKKIRSHPSLFQDDDLVQEENEMVMKNMHSKSRRRGLAGIAFLIKTLGSASAFKKSSSLGGPGLSLRDLLHLGRTISQNMGTLGFCFEPTKEIPGGTNYFYFELPKDEIEIGVGLNCTSGELQRGRLNKQNKEACNLHNQRVKLQSCGELVSTLIGTILPTLALPSTPGRAKVSVLVNNLGGLSTLEMYIFASKVVEVLEKDYNVEILRIYVGTFTSCLSTRGGSLTILQIPETKEKDILKYLDDTQATGIWPCNFYRKAPTKNRCSPQFTTRKYVEEKEERFNEEEDEGEFSDSEEEEEAEAGNFDFFKKRNFRKLLKVMIETLKESEDELNDLDAPIGDADCGTCLRRGMDLILDSEILLKLEKTKKSSFSPANVLGEIGMLMYQIGGTTGTIYCSFVMALAESYRKHHKFLLSQPLPTPTKQQFQNTNILHELRRNHMRKNNCQLLSRMLKDGCQAVSEIGGAKKGDCTFLDALVPVYEILDEKTEGGSFVVLEEMVEAARRGYLSTKEMMARVGKASMMKEKSIGFPDPAAKAVYNIFRDLKKEL